MPGPQPCEFLCWSYTDWTVDSIVPEKKWGPKTLTLATTVDGLNDKNCFVLWKKPNTQEKRSRDKNAQGVSFLIFLAIIFNIHQKVPLFYIFDCRNNETCAFWKTDCVLWDASEYIQLFFIGKPIVPTVLFWKVAAAFTKRTLNYQQNLLNTVHSDADLFFEGQILKLLRKVIPDFLCPLL